MANKRSEVSEVFTTYPSAPVSRATRMTSGSVWTVRNTILDGQPDSRSRLATCIPLSFGIEMSVTMMSGCNFMAASKRHSPSSTQAITSVSVSNRLRTAASSPGWSPAQLGPPPSPRSPRLGAPFTGNQQEDSAILRDFSGSRRTVTQDNGKYLADALFPAPIPPVANYFAAAATLCFVGFSVFAACFSGCP
jgi:hypothetical protein